MVADESVLSLATTSGKLMRDSLIDGYGIFETLRKERRKVRKISQRQY